MFFGRPWRQKRKVPLSPLQTEPLQPPVHMSLWRPPVYNVPGQERQFYESCLRSHDAFCGCGDFITHLNNLATRIGRAGDDQPPRPQRPPAIRSMRALPAPPTSGNQSHDQGGPWPGDGGGESAAGGPDDAGPPGDGDLAPEDVEELLELVEEAE